MKGKSDEEVRDELTQRRSGGEALEHLVPHKLFTGNKPTNSILVSRLTAHPGPPGGALRA